MQDKTVTSRAKPRKLLLTLPRRRPTEAPAASAFRTLLEGELASLMQHLETLDKAIEDIHHLVQDLMQEAKFIVGVEWTSHKTRPGLHPVFFRRNGRRLTTPFVRPGREPVPRRPWAVEVKSGYLERHQACMLGQEDLALPFLAEALRLARTLSEERDQVMDTLGAVRRLFTARRNATLASDVGAQVSELQQRSLVARSTLYGLWRS
jgi:hypothetical protein